MGGATECAIWSNYYIYNGYEENNEEIIPYGYSLDKQKLIIVDENMAECEVDTPGEIAIAGCGVAKGYYKDPEKTKKSFVDTEKWGRVYKTGDKGVLTSAGYINFLGRLDRQKKIRGYRVELEEIENVLGEITGRRCAVGVVNDCIIAKVVYNEGIDIKYIEEHIKARLPHYMIPGKIDFVDYIPETKNGKVDYSTIFPGEKKL